MFIFIDLVSFNLCQIVNFLLQALVYRKNLFLCFTKENLPEMDKMETGVSDRTCVGLNPSQIPV